MNNKHRASQGHTLASRLGLLLLLLGLASCETTPGYFGGLSGESRAERLAGKGEHSDAASVYIGMASKATGYERDRYTLLAAEQWLDAGDTARARHAQTTVMQPASGDLRWIWTTNAAALSLYDGKPDAALSLLDGMSQASVPTAPRLRGQALRADAHFQKGEPGTAVDIMVRRETWMNNSVDIEHSRQRLWKGLQLSQTTALREAADLNPEPVARGWLMLAALAKSTGKQGIGWSNGVARWREANIDHPAISIIDSMETPDALLLEYPRQVALLLPLSGRTARIGNAIQNGFIGAYFSTASGLDNSQSIRVYDIVTEGGASAAYATAVEEGAEFVVGPLLKSNVTELANDILVPVPVLTLNYLPDEVLAPPGLYQFALAPEDEAMSAAQRAIAEGHTRALALVPDNDWGRRLLNSFATEFEGLGGTVLDHRSFNPREQDFSRNIEALMSLSGSVNRYKRLRANLGEPLQFDPRRRQDADFIFLAANASAGRLLKSQLKFHYSGDLPVYSTSSINSMDGRSNADLNGIRFADTPWLIAPHSWIESLPALYEKSWPQERRLGRLHAMGFDAYNLIAELYAANSSAMDEIQGASGTLFLDQNGRVHRRLAWAEFSNGELSPLPALDIPGMDEFNEETSEEDAQDAKPWYEKLRDL